MPKNDEQYDIIRNTIMSFFHEDLPLSDLDKKRLESLTELAFQEKLAVLTSASGDEQEEHETNLKHILAIIETMAARKYLEKYDSGIQAFEKVVAAAIRLLISAVL